MQRDNQGRPSGADAYTARDAAAGRSSAEDILAFLDRIEGAGYGGQADFEIARAAAREMEAPRWQPIETAPKDGTHILAFRCPIGIRFTNLTNPPTVVHWFDDPDEPGFYTSVNELEPQTPFRATHWQSLPMAPSI